MNYNELIQTVASYLDREDLDNEIEIVDIRTFISAAEAKMNRFLRTGDMTQRAYATGNGSLNWFSFPDDYHAIRSIKVADIPLEFRTPEQIDRLSPADWINQAYYYTIQARQFRIIPAVSDGIKIEITFYKKVPNLSDIITTNWLLDDHYDVYWYGALAEACLFIKDYETAELWNVKFQEGLDSIDSADLFDRWSGSPAMVRAS